MTYAALTVFIQVLLYQAHLLCWGILKYKRIETEVSAKELSPKECFTEETNVSFCITNFISSLVQCGM